MCTGEQDALGGQSVQVWAGYVGMTVDAQIATEVVPMNDQNIVP
ncbi:Uncharacterised protein [Mycobacteroides abscessus subsp. abscessus]|nr:Uncharacterised protein [Mycobacteroides abscessus subsp. abscessus]